MNHHCFHDNLKKYVVEHNNKLESLGCLYDVGYRRLGEVVKGVSCIWEDKKLIFCLSFLKFNEKMKKKIFINSCSCPFGY